MEKQIALSFVGQQVTKDDIDTMGETAALADDRVFAELFALENLQKAVLCRDPSIVRITNQATGAIEVAPFRAFIGSRGSEATDPRAFHIDARSGICVGTTTRETAFTIAPIAPGGPDEKYRWDLVYAAITVNATGSATVRKVKSPTSGVVTAESVPPYYRATCTVAVSTGTVAVAADPVRPTLPADTASTFYVALAYIGRRNTEAILYPDQILEVAPMAQLQNQTSGPANSHHTIGGSVLTSAALNDWPKDFNRPRVYLPQSFGKKIETVFFAARLRTGNPSHTDGQIIDTRDWRKRIVRWSGYVQTSSTDAYSFAWEKSTHTVKPTPYGNDGYLDIDDGSVSEFVAGMGETFCTDLTGVRDPTVANIVYGATPAPVVATIVCDRTTGNLRLNYTGTPNVIFFLWMDFLSPYENGPLDF